MMKKYLVLLLPILGLFGLTVLNACSKDDHSHGNDATITIASPTAGQMFHGGEMVPIKATLTGEESLHGWKVEIRKKSDGTVLFTADAHNHAVTLTIDEVWVNNLTEHTDLVLEVFARIDHDGAEVSKTVNFHAHPM